MSGTISLAIAHDEHQSGGATRARQTVRQEEAVVLGAIMAVLSAAIFAATNAAHAAAWRASVRGGLDREHGAPYVGVANRSAAKKAGATYQPTPDLP